VTGEVIRRFAALAAALLAAAALLGCGDSDSSATDSTPAQQVGSNPGAESGANSKSGSKGSQDNGSQSGQSNETGNSPKSVETAPLEVSGGGSAQYRTKGGDNSVQEFGEEGDEAELEQAATALHDYLVARAEEDWPAACSHLARTVTDQLGELAARSDQLKGKDCAAILGALTPPLPASVRHESTIVDAGSLRLEDERAFLIYRGAEETDYAVVMEQEDGAWKVGALAATPIS
jgi:hypothetical protein